MPKWTLGRVPLCERSAVSCWPGLKHRMRFSCWSTLLVGGRSMLRRAAGSLLTHALQVGAQSKLEWDLRLQAWGTPGSLGWHEHGLSSHPKGMCEQAWGRRLALEWVFSCYWLLCEWRSVGGIVSRVPYFKAGVQELHVSWFSNTKDYLGW